MQVCDGVLPSEDEDRDEVEVPSPSILSVTPSPPSLPSSSSSSSSVCSSSFHSIAADVRSRRPCEKHGGRCPSDSSHPAVTAVTTKVLHLNTAQTEGGERYITTHLLSLPPQHLPASTPLHPSPYLNSSLPSSLLLSDAVHQRILTTLNSPASSSSSHPLKSFLFPLPLSSSFSTYPSASSSITSPSDKENHILPPFTPTSPFTSACLPPTFHLSPSSAFSPVGHSPSTPTKRRKTIHASPPASLRVAFRAMQPEGGKVGGGKERGGRRMPR